MFAKITIVLLASCAVVLARPQDASSLQEAQNQRLNQNQPQYYNTNQPQGWPQFQGLNPNQLQGLNPNQFQGLNSNQLQGLNPNQLQGLNSNQLQGLNPNQLQGLNPNQLQGLAPNQFQGLNPNQLQGLKPNQFQGLNLNQFPGFHLQNLIPGLNNGQGNPKYQSPILDGPYHLIDWGKNFVDTSVNHVGTALGQAYDNTEHIIHNVADTVNEFGRRGLQDGTNLFKTGVGLFSTIPRLGFGLLSRSSNNNNNEYRY